jgi:hypothetical protein
MEVLADVGLGTRLLEFISWTYFPSHVITRKTVMDVKGSPCVYFLLCSNIN